MERLDGAIVAALIVVVTTILFVKHQQIRELIETFRDNFPRGPFGGPPSTPMHPSPAGDDSLLRPNSRQPARRK